MKNKKWTAALLAAALAVTSITPFAISETETLVSEVQAAETQTEETSPTDGDVDGLNNGLDVCDMIRMKRYRAGQSVTINAENSDVDGDNGIDDDDTNTLLEALVGGPIKHYWADDRKNMTIGADASNNMEISYTNSQKGVTYILAQGKSKDVYLSGDFTPVGGNMFGIIIRQGSDIRRVGFQNTGITVMSNLKWMSEGVPDFDQTADHYDIFKYNTAGQLDTPYVWAQNTNGTSTQQSAISTMLSAVGTASKIKWVITQGILYASIKDVPVLRIPLDRLCATWTADLEYEIGLAGWDVDVNPFKVANVEVCYGEDALAKIAEDKSISSFAIEGNSSEMYYNDVTGTYLPRTYSGAAYGYGTGWTGVQSVSTTIKQVNINNTESLVGISVKVGNESAQILTDTEATWIYKNHVDTDKKEITAKSAVQRYDENGVLRIVGLIQPDTNGDMSLDLYYNKLPVTNIPLKDIFTGYTGEEEIQLGICTYDAHKGLVEFEDTRFLTWGDADATNTDTYRMEFIFDDNGIGLKETATASGAYYQYLGKYSNQIYLSTDYTTSDVVDNWEGKEEPTFEKYGLQYRQFLYGITLRDASGESREIEFHSNGVSLRTNQKWSVKGLPGAEVLEESDGTEDGGTIEDGGVSTVATSDEVYSEDDFHYMYNDGYKSSYVWTRRDRESARDYSHSAFGEVATKKETGTYPVEWLVKDGVLYATFRNEPVLSLPLSKLNTNWDEDTLLQIGLSAWDTNINCRTQMTKIDLRFGEDTQTKEEPKVTSVAEDNSQYIEYHPLCGYLTKMDENTTYAYAYANVGVKGIRAKMTLYDMDHASSYTGVTIRSGSQSAQIMVNENDKLAEEGGSNTTFNIFGNHTQFGNNINNNGVPAYSRELAYDYGTTYHGYSDITVIIKNYRLYVFANGKQAGSAELYKLIPGYQPGDEVQIGFAACAQNEGLATISQVELLTDDEVNELKTSWQTWKFAYVPQAAANGDYNALTGTLEKTRSFKPIEELGVGAYVKFTGITGVWEITGTMRRPELTEIDAETTLEGTTYTQAQVYATQLLQGIKIYGKNAAGEEKELNVVGQNKGVAPNFAYTHNNGGSKYVYNTATERFFLNATGTNKDECQRTLNNIAFRFLIKDDTLYAWFNDIPTWKIPLKDVIEQPSEGIKFGGFVGDSQYSVALYIGDNIGMGSFENVKVRTGMGVMSTDVTGFVKKQ